MKVIWGLLFWICLGLGWKIPQVNAANEFLIGWWVDSDENNPQVLDQLAAQGNTLVLLPGYYVPSGTGAGSITSYQAYLNRAQTLGIKVIVSLTGGSIGTPAITAAQTVTVVNALKNYPALYGWYIGDEPEMNSSTSSEALDRLLNNPGYYPIIKANDPVHPVMISFDRTAYDNAALAFYPALDWVGTHAYPKIYYGPTTCPVDGRNEFVWYGGCESNREPYDDWKTDLETVRQRGKTGYIATAQGISNMSVYIEPTENELRYQVFSAIVSGADKVMFWMNTWSSTTLKAKVARIIGQVQTIGGELNRGVTNDPRIGVSETSRDRLVYRYGINGNNQAILAVNIANRRTNQGTGATLSNVQSTLPSGVNPAQVTVVGESRSLAVSNGRFTDNFAPYAVHLYQYQAGSTSIPGDYNGDQRVDFLDLENVVSNGLGIGALNLVVRNL